MPTEYTLTDLAKLAKVTPRTVRYYISQGLLPPPAQTGSTARYTEGHLDRLRLIKKLQSAHLPLAEIRARLRALPEDELARLADDAPADGASGSALDYIEAVLGGGPDSDSMFFSLPAAPAAPAAPAQPAAAPMANLAAEPAPAPGPAPTSASEPEPERAQWERITLDPDVELHIRRPLTRQQNKRVERLISIARQLLEED